MTETEQMILYYQERNKYPPCYDRHTGEHCIERHVGCHATCKRWAEYQAERDERYRKKKFDYDSNVILFEAMSRMKKPRHKKVWHSGDNYKKK